MRFETLRELYLHSIDSFGPRPCFSMYGGESLTYAEFSERVNTLIDIFVHAGLSSGDKIALLSNNMPNWGVAYFAATVSGMVIVPILPDFSGPELDKIILHSEAKALVVSDKLFTKVSKEVISGLNLVVRSMNLGVIHQTSDTLGSVTIPNGDDLAAIIYTSGTTSSPKGVMLSHRNLCSELEMVSILQPVYPDDVFLSILPLSHTYECSLGMLLPVMWGASVVYLDKAPTATVLLPVLKKVRPTIMRHQSTGPMLEGVEARLDNVNPRSGEGEIVVKGPNVMMGYYKNPEATADSFTEDGWFRTKDLGVFDRDGYLYIKGRLTNMILGPSGENIYPEEIENVINGHALVADSLVKEDMGKLVAIVHFNREALEQKYHTVRENLGQKMENIKQDLMHYVNSKVNKFSRISVVVENEDGFEKTPTQKIKRFLYTKKK